MAKTTDFISPMLATLVSDFPKDGTWIYEKKFDGYRLTAVVKNGKAILYSRTGIDVTKDYQTVAVECSKIGHNVVLDGEVIHLDNRGRTTFQGLQQYRKTATGSLQYCVFDLLSMDGHETTGMQLIERKGLLKSLLAVHPSKVVRYTTHVKDGRKLFAKAQEQGWEGVIGKRTTATYLPGKRTDYFIKIKTSKRQELIICGYTAPAGSRKYFGALLLGYYDDKKLLYAGKVGTGFNDAGLKELYEKMQPSVIFANPFETPARNNYYSTEAITWLKPKLVAEIQFSEWTDDNRLRHPSYLGLRNDKQAVKVVREAV